MELRVCGKDELKDGAVRIVTADKLEVAVIRHEGKHFAYRNHCPHQGGPACEGVRMPLVVDVIDDEGYFRGQRFQEDEVFIVCPWHGYEFRLETGEHAGDPSVRLKRFELIERDGDVYVIL
jgi:nitrite reductase/ring-hydroxylating ferredoxin subunit